eukprot:RCo024550
MPVTIAAAIAVTALFSVPVWGSEELTNRSLPSPKHLDNTSHIFCAKADLAAQLKAWRSVNPNASVFVSLGGIVLTPFHSDRSPELPLRMTAGDKACLSVGIPGEYSRLKGVPATFGPDSLQV